MLKTELGQSYKPFVIQAVLDDAIMQKGQEKWKNVDLPLPFRASECLMYCTQCFHEA
jgi:hypothetical protein